MSKDSKNPIFLTDIVTSKELKVVPHTPITNFAKRITSDANEICKQKGQAFANEITEKFVADFERTEQMVKEGKASEADQMVHVTTFMVIDDTIYLTYYANTKNPNESPEFQTARIAYCPVNDTKNLTVLDVQTVGDTVDGRVINQVYDTIMMRKDEDTIFVMWTARIEENYFRFYRPFNVKTKSLGETKVHRFKVGEVVNDFSVTGIKTALAENDLPIKNMFADIGIMQKTSTHVEDGKTYYYTGAYSGDFTCIIKSTDLITWEYVSQPDFDSESIWENATYVIGDRVFYFVRQHDGFANGFLTVYDLNKKTWETPVLIDDCQSRSDFIIYNDNLYLFHAPISREHIGIVKIDTDNIANSSVVLQAHMHTSCFYPFIQYFKDGELAMSYTVNRKHVRLARFTLSKYLD